MMKLIQRQPRHRLWFFVIMIVIILAVNWPGYAFFSGYEPFILGFPLSFAWLIMWVLIAFVAMLWLYINDDQDEEGAEA